MTHQGEVLGSVSFRKLVKTARSSLLLQSNSGGLYKEADSFRKDSLSSTGSGDRRRENELGIKWRAITRAGSMTSRDSKDRYGTVNEVSSLHNNYHTAIFHKEIPLGMFMAFKA